MSTRVTVRKNSYKDSVRLLEATRAILGSPGVSWGWALMATPHEPRDPRGAGHRGRGG